MGVAQRRQPAGKGPPTEGHQFTEVFNRNSREIARARKVVERTLRSWGLGADVPVFSLVVSELVSNALLHGSGMIRLALSYARGRVRLEVSDDGGRSVPELKTQTVGGWGLRFVAEVADSWGTELRDPGTVVWMARRSARLNPVAPGLDAGSLG